MARNLIVCCDGTSNEFGPQNTNVVRLVQVLDRDPTAQLVYYDPGVGTLPEPGIWSRAGKAISELWGLAFGAGLTRNVEEAYTFLMNNWRPGDAVFLFGFSRGAYTVRVLAGLLHLLGLLPRGSDNLVPYLMRLYRGLRGAGDQSIYWRVCAEFRESFAQTGLDIAEDRRFPVAFLGVWDTVSSVGWVWNQATYPYTAKNPSVARVRHVVSIDERRWFFRQNLFVPIANQDLEELWFAGVHSDVGGGYPRQDGDLWRPPFEWIAAEARTAGLRIDEAAWGRVLGPQPETPWRDPAHESLTWGWWPAELFPKLTWRKSLGRRLPAIGLGRHRRIRPGSLLHQSVLKRLREKADYRPPNLSGAFCDRVRALQQVPPTLAV